MIAWQLAGQQSLYLLDRESVVGYNSAGFL